MNAATEERRFEPALQSAGSSSKGAESRVALKGHIGALDGVRGLAILLVFLHHFAGSVGFEFQWYHPVLSLFRLGWAGVDLFFVLSGFLITGILLDAKGKPNYVKNFYARRALRIFPLYYITLVVLALLKLVWPSAGFYPAENQGWLWIYATNIVIALKGYDSFGVVEHFWSLAVEEHFYLVWPFVVLFLDRRRLLFASVATWFVSLGIRILLEVGGAHAAAPYVFTPARVDSLTAGAFIAILAREGGLERLRRPAWIVGVVSLIGFSSLVLLSGSPHHDTPLVATIGPTLLAGTFGGTLILAQTYRPLERAFNAGFLRFFGKYSYGLYVWHPLLFIIVLHTDAARGVRGGNDVPHALAMLAIAFASTALVTALSWHLVESKFLNLKKYFH